MSASLYKKAPKADVLHFDYDFSVDGGAVSAISLGEVPENFVITEVFVSIETTITSGGVPTIEIGNAADANGYVADFFGTPSAGQVLKGAGALVSGGVYRVAAANVGVLLTIGTAALTAGKFHVQVYGHMAY